MHKYIFIYIIYYYVHTRTIFTFVAIGQPRYFIANTRVYRRKTLNNSYRSATARMCRVLCAIKLLASTTDVCVVRHTEVLIYSYYIFMCHIYIIYVRRATYDYNIIRIRARRILNNVTASLGYRNICWLSRLNRIDHRPRDYSLVELLNVDLI